MSFVTVGAVITIGAGVAKAVSSGMEAKKRKQEAAESKADFEKMKSQFASLDTSNPYTDMENVYEDLTVDKQASDFKKDMFMGNQANVLDAVKQTGNFTAGNIQALVGAGAVAGREASADIAQQERANQMAERGEAGRLQNLERQGEIMSRDMERNKVSTLMGMDRQDYMREEALSAQANQAMWAGIGGVGSALMGGALSGLGGGGGGGARRGGGGNVGGYDQYGAKSWERGDNPNAPYVGLSGPSQMGPRDNFTGPGGYQYRDNNLAGWWNR